MATSNVGAPVWVLVGVMLLTGSLNTILNKLQDLQCVENCDNPDPNTHHHFEQPVWQTINMFIGEAMCLVVFYVNAYLESRKTSSAYHPIDSTDESSVAQPHAAPAATAPVVDISEDTPLNGTVAVELKPMKGWALLLLWLPTLCDLTATSLMNVGLLFISASIYQMLRGSVVLFTGVFSTIFLGRRHAPYRWFALITVFVGVMLVGASSILQGDATSKVPVKSSYLGVFLVIIAQSFTATQFVIEEKLLSRYNIPAMKAVGLEGLFGLLSAAIGLPIAYFAYGRNGPEGNYFDVPVGFHQMIDFPVILSAGVGICFSIAFFNWSGLSVTRSVSATARSTIDTCRTVFIWMISLGLGWETFKPLQVVGFLVLIYGSGGKAGKSSPKKNGSGGHNWGQPGDELRDLDMKDLHNLTGTGSTVTSPTVRVMARPPVPGSSSRPSSSSAGVKRKAAGRK
ncbi:hypothetical protein HDU76_013020 [Blyttiomyces sp. JEL0837]|nr:hypothetical protein HDU76_013020 [Blyttiomyces sp. JEL0837]